MTDQLGGVFSWSAELLPARELARIPGVIDAGEDHPSGPTFFGRANDIPEDFRIKDVRIQVPEGASCLFVALPDSYFKDNKDVGEGYGVRITRLPVSWWSDFVPLPAARSVDVR